MSAPWQCDHCGKGDDKHSPEGHCECVLFTKEEVEVLKHAWLLVRDLPPIVDRDPLLAAVDQMLFNGETVGAPAPPMISGPANL